MDAYNKFVLTHFSQIWHYLNPSSPTLDVKKDYKGLTQQAIKHHKTVPSLPTPQPLPHY